VPVWGYFVLGFIIVSLVLLTFRRNTAVVHTAPSGYGDDFRLVLDQAQPAIDELREAMRVGEEQGLSRAASSARSRIHANISNLDRLSISERLPEEQRVLLESLRSTLRKAMENYEWAARIAETTDPLDNPGLRRAFESLAGSGDQLCAEARFELVAVTSGVAQGAETSV
jgi:hypothetical protein